MENETEEVVVEETPAEETQADETEATDWKAKYDEAQGRLRRAETKLSKVKAEEPKAEKQPSKSDELDYGQKAYLVANDIKAQDEVKLVREVMKDTGKTLEQVLESKYFQAEIKEMRELKKSADATPSKSNRSNISAKDDVEYWISKGELPEDRTLRSKVVAERRARDTNSNPFRR